ncbi:MAG: carboxymuconolactone decarboxylase family protein [Planctomycetota bacterium]|jgi:AhpD family alkylhydroperoxidase
MPHRSIKQFREDRATAQARVLETEHLGIKRFFSLDSATYRDSTDRGGLDAGTKHLLGMAVSMALRCNDCIDYHLEGCVQEGVDEKHIEEAFNIAMLIGGSIVIPHLRHARLSLDELLEERAQQ